MTSLALHYSKKFKIRTTASNCHFSPFFLSLRVARVVETLILLHFDLLAERIEAIVLARRFINGIDNIAYRGVELVGEMLPRPIPRDFGGRG